MNRFVCCLVLSGLALLPLLSPAQTAELTVTVEGLLENASATLTVERGVGGLDDATLVGLGEGTPVDHTFTLATGPWTVSIDAPGHASPAAQEMDLTGDAALTLDVAALAGDSTTYIFSWEEDGSIAGHATEFVPADPPVIEVLGEAYTVPDGFSAQTLFQQYGFILDDHELAWTPDDAFKLQSASADSEGPDTSALEGLGYTGD